MTSTQPTLHTIDSVLTRGTPLAKAKHALILLHGRGSTAEDIMQLADDFAHPEMAYLAPRAADNSWYPQRFFVETKENQPWLDSALAVVGKLVAQCSDAGLPAEKIYLMGFSQGACLALDYAAQNPKRYGGVFGFSGALIGAEDEERSSTGSLADTPVFLGCSNIDPHIPASFVRDSAIFLKGLGGKVLMKLYPMMGHTVNADEIALVRVFMGLDPAPTPGENGDEAANE